jgi:hypothetical protein
MAGETAKMGPFLAFLLMLMILLRTTRCGATTSIMKDNATFPYLGGMDEPELKFDSEISRMLIDYNNYVTTGTNNANKPVVDCSRSPRYDSCLPQKNSVPKGEKCDPYKRNC